MSLSRVASLLVVSALLVPVGCAAPTDESPAEAGDEVATNEDEITSGVSNFGYYVVTHRDVRKCAAPACGGFFVKRVNAAKTRCADGSLQAECYVGAIGFGGTKLSPSEEASFRSALESGHGLVHARMYKTTANGRVVGTLKADEAWLGATGSAPDGTFYRVADNGIRCITAPCPSTTATPLNGVGNPYDVVNVRLDATPSPADPTTLGRATNALGTAEGVIVAGGIALPKCIPGSHCGPLAHATEFYVRVVRREGKSCGGHVIDPNAFFCNEGQFCN